jgi:hypothetical protein
MRKTDSTRKLITVLIILVVVAWGILELISPKMDYRAMSTILLTWLLFLWIYSKPDGPP